MAEIPASQANMETPEQAAYLDEIARLTSENKKLKLWRSLGNKDWKEADLDYRLAMCAGLTATILDALQSFDEKDLALCPFYIQAVFPNLITEAEKQVAWFDHASTRMMSCGSGSRPSAIGLARKSELRD